MGFWTELRDAVQTAGVIAGNVILPGSSLVTSKLVSKGSQEQLGSDLGKLAQLGSGGYGAYTGNLANYSTAYDKVAGAFGGGTGAQVTGQQAVQAFNAGQLSAAEFEAIAQGAGTTSQGLLSGAGGISKLLTPAALFGSSLIGANAAQSVAATGAQAAAETNRVAYQMYQEQKALQDPYRTAGVTAQNRLMDLLGLSENKTGADYGKYGKDFAMTDFNADPGYAFRLSEGQKTLDAQAAARGGLISGNALRAATKYGQDMGSQEYQNAYNRYQTNRSNQLNPLGSLITSGQNAAANTGAAASNYGSNLNTNISNAAAAKAAGDVGTSNALTGGLNTYLNYSSNQDYINAMERSRSTYRG